MDKRVEKNIENINNIKSLLVYIINNPENALKEFPNIYSEIKTQHSLAALVNDKFNIKLSSLNTLKRTSVKVFENGFTELDKLRDLAVKKLESCLNKSNKKHLNKEDKIKQLKKEVEDLEKVYLLCINQLLEDLNTFKNIKNINSIEVVKLLSDKSISKIKDLGLYSDKLVNLSGENKLKVIK